MLMRMPCPESQGGTLFRIQSKGQVAGLALWGVPLLYSGTVKLVRI